LSYTLSLYEDKNTPLKTTYERKNGSEQRKTGTK
jgi:hypothetical protein